jgi:hypothetical protein
MVGRGGAEVDGAKVAGTLASKVWRKQFSVAKQLLFLYSDKQKSHILKRGNTWACM